MTRRPPEELLRELGRAPIPVEEAEVTSERRKRMLSRIAAEVRTSHGNARARRFRRSVAWFFAAAALLLLVSAGLRARRVTPLPSVASLRTDSPVMVSHSGQTEVASSETARALDVGDGVSTLADSRADLRLASGVEIAVEPSTRIVIAEAHTRGEVVSLALGQIFVRVPRLGPDRSFVVRTPDAKVVVHGTAFVVRVEAAAGGTLTRVEVTEGKVAVERGSERVMLGAGERWPARVAHETVPAPKSAGANPSTSAPTELPRPAFSAKPAQGKLASASALAEQNRLFGVATQARRRADDRKVVEALSQLISRYPDSVLVPEARVERFRALKRMGHDAEAAREARKYLVEQRDGAARDEARGLALEPKK